MKFQVIRSRRKGRLLMMFARNEYGVFEGELMVKETYVKDLNRHSTVATLLDENCSPVKGLAPLYDAVLTSAKKGYWTMTGFERMGLSSMEDFCQSWIMSPLDEAPRPPETNPIKSSEDAARDVAQLPAKREAGKAAAIAARERAQIDKQWPPRSPPET